MRQSRGKNIMKSSGNPQRQHGRGKPKPAIPPAIREAKHAKDYLDEVEAEEEVKQWAPKKKRL